MSTLDPNAASTVTNCGCRCHTNPGAGCDPAHDTGSSGVPGQLSCGPHALPDTSSPAEQLEAAVHHDADALLVDVEFIAEHWTDLGEHRRTGTRRTWRQALLDPETRARTLARDAEERAERDPDAPGFTAAPLHIDVLDVAVDTWIVLDELAHMLLPDMDSRWTKKPTTASTDLGPSLAVIRELCTDIALARLPAAKVNRVGRRLSHAVTEISRVLALVRAGQLLTGAVCPWCHGVTPKHPAGGHTTMRVEELPGSRHRDLSPTPAVVCWNILCDPPSEAAGTRLRGRPAWPIHEWDWLAPQLIVAEPARSQPRPLPSRPAGFEDTPVLPIERYAGTGISRTAPVTPPDATERLPDPPKPGQPVTFVGGPFARQTRRFTRTADTLAVTRTTNGRPALAPDDTTDDRLGSYTLALVNDHTAYVWTTT